jgi:hypothetical protein
MSRRPALLAALALIVPACSTENCNTIAADVGDLCLPPAVAPDVQLTIELREMCGKGCSHQPSCDALLRNGQVFLDVRQDVCQDTLFLNCIQLGCVRRVIRCTLPALPEGDYALAAPGAGVQLLRVRAGGQSSCRFPAPADGGV